VIRMPGVLIGVGVILIVLTLLLAFTIFGEISAVLGLGCVAIGAVMMGRGTRGPGAGRSS
jgi:hypothetical protein